MTEFAGQMSGATIAIMLVQWLKGQSWFPWANVDTARLNFLTAIIMAVLSSIVVSWSFQNGVFAASATGLSMASLKGALTAFLPQFAQQEILYRLGWNK